ncbi:MAG: hypothetical protein ACI9WT_000299 [Flavobacterium sp.]|jgi:hypothetical protein
MIDPFKDSKEEIQQCLDHMKKSALSLDILTKYA